MGLKSMLSANEKSQRPPDVHSWCSNSHATAGANYGPLSHASRRSRHRFNSKFIMLHEVPFPLPDIIIEEVHIFYRAVGAQDITCPTWNINNADGPMRTAEAKGRRIFDGLWLVVRESIGDVRV